MVKARDGALVCAALLIILVIACTKLNSVKEAQGASGINVAAAANLSDAFSELGKQFTAQTGVPIIFSFGSTADLARQIANGAPFDVYASADIEHVDELDRQGLLLSNTKELYARGRLVLWTAPGSRLAIERIEDMTKDDVKRVGIAKPDVAPYGRAAVEALRTLNIWSNVEPKVYYGQNVSQVKQYAATGNVDAAFIPRSLVRPSEGGRAIEVSAQLHQPINQAIAVIKASDKQDAARRFVAFVTSAQGQTLLEKFGYDKVK
jgi:molybdate transport system substrate-binding protein